MGNDITSIKDYYIGQPFNSNDESQLKVIIAPAINSIDNKKYTTFHYLKDKGKLPEAAGKHIEVLRTTRHPYILRYCTTFEESKKTILVTEHVTPLDTAVEQLEKIEIFAGLFNILEAVVFLQERSNICHNSISVSSVFVTDSGVWKLAAFEKSSKVLRLSKQSYDNDIAGFSEFALSVLEYLKDDGPSTQRFMQRLEMFVNEDKEVTASLQSLVKDPFFKITFLEILEWLQTLPLKSTVEKRRLFGSLSQQLRVIPSSIVGKRIIPLLFSQPVLCDPVADEQFLKHLFASGNDYCLSHKVEPCIDQEHFKKYCLPLILALYESRDITVRLIIIKYIAYYVDFFPKDVVQSQILPELLFGLKDDHNVIVALTFHALEILVPLLGAEAVVGGERCVCFYDRAPDFTRVLDRNSLKAPLLQTVSDVLNQQIKISATQITNPDEVVEDTKERRLARERKREEQRRKREERKQERDARKGIRLQTQSSDETPPPPMTSSEIEILSEELEASRCNMEHDDDSEPDWEGFEAFSDAETKGDPILSAGYKTMSNDDWGWHDDDSPRNFIDVEKKDQKRTAEKDANLNDHINTNTTKLNSMTSLTLGKRPDPSKGPESKPNNAQNTTDTGRPNKWKQSSDFDVYDITVDKSKFSEPDYFADMIPSMGNQATRTVIIQTKRQDINSKFDAVNVDSQDSTGWGADEDSTGWGDDDF